MLNLYENIFLSNECHINLNFLPNKVPSKRLDFDCHVTGLIN